MEIRDYKDIVRRRIHIFLLSSLAFIAGACYLIFLQPKEYKANTKILVEKVAPNASPQGPNGSAAEEMPNMADALKYERILSISTQMELIRGRPVWSIARKMTGYSPSEVSYRVYNVQDSDIVIIQSLSKDPDKAVRFSNALADAYILFLRSKNIDNNRDARDFLMKQRDAAFKKLIQAEENRRNFKQSTGIVDLNIEQSKMVSELVDMQSAYHAAQLQLQETQSHIDSLRQQLPQETKEIFSSEVLSGNPVIAELSGQITDMETKLAGLRQKYGPKHPQIVSLEASIQYAQERMSKEALQIISSRTKTINPMYQNLVADLFKYEADELGVIARLNSMKPFIDKMQEKTGKLPEDEAQISRLTREVLLDERLYNSLTQQYQDFRIAEQTQKAPASVVERAINAEPAAMANRLFFFAVAIAAGLALGGTIVLAIHYFDTALYTIGDVEKHLGLTVLTNIPYDKTIQRNPLVTMLFPNSPIAESFRFLRNGLKSVMPDLKGKTLLVTSALMGEGKSTIASNLAVTLAQNEFKVLLFDADIRRPYIHTIFNMENEGLESHPQLPNLFILPSGLFQAKVTNGMSSSDLMETERIRELFDEMKKQFEVIIIDTAPVLPVNDVLSLAQTADGIIWVLQTGLARQEEALEAKRKLGATQTPILGIVLNRASPARYYYQSYYYSDNKRRRKKKRELSDMSSI